MTNTHDTDTGLASCYDEPAAIPSTLSLTPEPPLVEVVQSEVVSTLPDVKRINEQHALVSQGVLEVRRAVCDTLSAALVAGMLLTELKPRYHGNWGRLFDAKSTSPGSIHFSQQTGARYVRMYADAYNQAQAEGCLDEMQRQLRALAEGCAFRATLAVEMLERARKSRAALQELGALPAPPAPSLGEVVEKVAAEHTLLSPEQRREQSWTHWGGCCSQLETYIAGEAAELPRRDREVVATRLEELAATLRAMPGLPGVDALPLPR